jgi:Post-segregation antitoxin CcdA
VNVTVSISQELLREARHEAVDRGLSLSRYLAELLEEHLEGRRRYRRAWQEQRELMEQGPLRPLRQATWTRDELHER